MSTELDPGMLHVANILTTEYGVEGLDKESLAQLSSDHIRWDVITTAWDLFHKRPTLSSFSRAYVIRKQAMKPCAVSAN